MSYRTPATNFLLFRPDKTLVNISAQFLRVGMWVVRHSFIATASLTKWKQMEFYFFFNCDSGLEVLLITDILSP